jgi:uncharacterized membrane protein YgdD (TMEM256/DUF423 family)
MLDDSLSRRMIVYAAICGATGVALGALGAHGLEDLLKSQGYEADVIPRRLQQFDTAVRYQLFHTIALLGLAGLPYGSPASRRWVCRMFVLGVVLFSGSLYALVLSNVTKLGWVLLLLVAKRASSTTT